jgi:hypothetical protein
MTFVASVPGAIVLVALWLRGSGEPTAPEPARRARVRVSMRSDGAADA